MAEMTRDEMIAKLELALNQALLGRGVLLAQTQRNYRINTAAAMRLHALRDACFDAIAVIAALSTPPPALDRANARRMHIAFNVMRARSGQRLPACDGPDCLLCDFLQAQWKPAATPPPADNEHEYQLIANAVGERGKTDCSTPLYVRVMNLVERWDATPPPADLVAHTRDIEWSGAVHPEYGECCPHCGNERPDGHHPVCKLAAALSAYPIPAAPPVVSAVPVPEHHQRAAATFRALATPVPMFEAERTADDPDYGLTPAPETDR